MYSLVLGLNCRNRAGPRITAVVVEHLSEVERRRLFIDWGFASLFEYIKRELGYSESAAWRRVEAARTLIAIPEIKEDLETGALKLSQIVMAQKAIKEDQKTNGRMSLEAKKELFEEIRNKTAVETQKILDRDFDLPIPSIEKHKRDESVELQIRLPREEYEKLMRVKELYSHIIPNGDWVAVFSQMANDVIKARDPLAKNPVEKAKVSRSASDAAVVSVKASAVSSATDGAIATDAACATATINRPQARAGAQKKSVFPTRRPLKPTVRRFVFQRDRFCQHRDPDGSICQSRHMLEIDHIHPIWAEGGDDVSNLRLLCRVHNLERYRRSV